MKWAAYIRPLYLDEPTLEPFARKNQQRTAQILASERFFECFWRASLAEKSNKEGGLAL
jgi:hypothetical protein